MRNASSALLTPTLDFLMIGGLSLFAMAGVFALGFNDPVWIEWVAWLAFVAGFIVNSPHFAASYQLFYSDHKDKIFSSVIWIFVGIVAPAIMSVYLVICYFTLSTEGLSILVHLMFLLVGWHYVKQVFGCIIVTTARAGYKISPKQRLFLRLNMYSIWSLSLFFNHDQVSTFVFNGIPYETFRIPAQLSYASMIALVVTLLLLIYYSFKQYKITRAIPPLSSITAFVAIYAWYIPILYHPAFFLMVPFFHSLQYLLFVFAYKKNRYKQQSHARSVVVQFALFFLLCVFLGGLFMETLPRTLDTLITIRATDYMLLLASFNLLINIHHYFIDHLIWRGSLPEVQKYLLQSS